MPDSPGADDTASTAQVVKPQHRPKDSAIKQQRLPACQPILTAKTIFPVLFVIAPIFIAIGGVLVYFSNSVNEYVYDYTNCVSTTNSATPCNTMATGTCTCSWSFQITSSSTFQGAVYMYYGLSNFFQNHRRYVKSRDDVQLNGQQVSSLNSECSPFDYYKNSNGSTYQYAPCGAIANSFWNDTFQLTYNGQYNNTNTTVNLISTGIAWSSDVNNKFNNPSTWANTIQPVNWNVSVQQLTNNYKNEDLIVWMRTAALPTFRKLYRIIDLSSFGSGVSALPAGYYTVTVNYNYPVMSFQGTKSFVLSTCSFIGGKNPFLGIVYLIVGSLCLILAIVFLIIHLKYSKYLKEAYELNNMTAGASYNTANENIEIIDLGQQQQATTSARASAVQQRATPSIRTNMYS